MAVTEYAFQGPKRGADRAVLLAHGAGADMHAAALTTTADALASARIPSLRFNFPYRTAGRRAPDRPPVLDAAVREAVAELCARTKLAADRLVLGGRSMGGRICSMVAADPGETFAVGPLALVLMAYPLHPPGNAEKLRVEHLARLHMATLFISGTRDPFGTPAELRRHAKKIKGPVTFQWIETGDHGFKPLKASGETVEAVLASVADNVVRFVAGLPGRT